jgi:site-specific recombinase XerD
MMGTMAHRQVSDRVPLRHVMPMSGKSLAHTDDTLIATMVQMVEDALTSAHSKRAYRRALIDFLAWYRGSGQTQLNKATVQRYATELYAEGASAANINQRLSAIRKLASEACDNDVLPPQVATGIQRVRGIRQEGRCTGNWLTLREAQLLMNAPDPRTLKGKRDRALLGVLLGTGVRRSEAAGLTLEQVQQRDGRWVIADLIGKRNKMRTVPMPSWCKMAIDAWTRAAVIICGRLFRPVNKGDHLVGEGIAAQSVYVAIKTHARPIGMTLAAHDTRRTFAKLAHKGGAATEQIQLTLGHQSLTTTERYLGLEQDLTDAPCDHLGLRWDETVV